MIELEIKDKTQVKSIKKIVVDSTIPEDKVLKEITQKHLGNSQNLTRIKKVLILSIRIRFFN